MGSTRGDNFSAIAGINNNGINGWIDEERIPGGNASNRVSSVKLSVNVCRTFSEIISALVIIYPSAPRCLFNQ